MSGGEKRGVARQAANLVGALFQVGVTAVASAAISDVVDSGPTPLVEPALYAFFVWGPIFALSLVYAAYQALPANRENPLLRRVGWFTAVAFFCTGMWSVFVPARQLVLAELMLVSVFACLLVAYLRLARSDRGALTGAGRWLVALPVGIFLGWITAASVVTLARQAVRFGLVNAGGTGEALIGAALLLLGSLLARAVVLAGKGGPPQGCLAYGATVLWALVGVVVNQYDASLLMTIAAVLSAALVALALLDVLRGHRWRRGADQGMRVAGWS